VRRRASRIRRIGRICLKSGMLDSLSPMYVPTLSLSFVEYSHWGLQSMTRKTYEPKVNKWKVKVGTTYEAWCDSGWIMR
jgi:hypothetical protein